MNTKEVSFTNEYYEKILRLMETQRPSMQAVFNQTLPHPMKSRNNHINIEMDTEKIMEQAMGFYLVWFCSYTPGVTN